MCQDFAFCCNKIVLCKRKEGMFHKLVVFVIWCTFPSAITIAIKAYEFKSRETKKKTFLGFLPLSILSLIVSKKLFTYELNFH